MFERQQAQQVLLLRVNRNLWKENTQPPALAFATLGKELFPPPNFSFPLVLLARRALGPQPLVGSKFTALAGRVAYL